MARKEIRLLGRMDFLGKTANLVGGDAANSLRPLGGFRRSIISAEHVILKVIFGRSALGHMVSIETDTILVEEVLIKKVVFDLVIHYANAEGGICTRSNGNPLVSQRLRRLVKPGLNNDDFPACLACGIELMRRLTALVGSPIAAEHDMQIAILQRQ